MVSLLFLFLDIYPQVKSFRAMLSTGSFLLLWLVFSGLVGVAYLFLMKTSVGNIEAYVGGTGTKLTAIILSAVMGATIIQSLSLKISEIKIVNLQGLLDDYRRQVLEDITKRNSRIERRRAFLLGDQLVERFANHSDELRQEYCQILLFTIPEDAENMHQRIEKDATAMKIDSVKLIAIRLARTDSDRAKQLLQKKAG